MSTRDRSLLWGRRGVSRKQAVKETGRGRLKIRRPAAEKNRAAL